MMEPYILDLYELRKICKEKSKKVTNKRRYEKKEKREVVKEGMKLKVKMQKVKAKLKNLNFRNFKIRRTT